MLRFVFGEKNATVRADGTGVRVGAPCPVLSGPAEQTLDFGPGVFSESDGFAAWRTPDTLVLATAVPLPADDIEGATRRAYAEIFKRTAGLHLYRVWHFVPGILTRPEGREETYRRFCVGRAEAFDAAFSGEAEGRMSAASATGCDGDRLVVVVVAGTAVPAYFENPAQTPAYRYPREYGPRSPSFARASRVTLASGEWVFVSGTAAITGSESMHPGDLAAQAALTGDNLAAMLRLAGGESARAAMRVSRVYLKTGGAAPAGGFPGVSGESLVIMSDVCRDELLVEAETTMRLVPKPSS